MKTLLSAPLPTGNILSLVRLDNARYAVFACLPGGHRYSGYAIRQGASLSEAFAFYRRHIPRPPRTPQCITAVKPHCVLAALGLDSP